MTDKRFDVDKHVLNMGEYGKNPASRHQIHKDSPMDRNPYMDKVSYFLVFYSINGAFTSHGDCHFCLLVTLAPSMGKKCNAKRLCCKIDVLYQIKLFLKLRALRVHLREQIQLNILIYKYNILNIFLLNFKQDFLF